MEVGGLGTMMQLLNKKDGLPINQFYAKVWKVSGDRKELTLYVDQSELLLLWLMLGI